MKLDELLFTIQEIANTIATPNWADIMSACCSLIAVVVAGIIACRQNKISEKQTDIADKQNKIALFEKRLEIYDILKSCNSGVGIIKSLGENEDILKYLFIIFSDNPKKYQEYNRNEARLYLTNCSIKLQRADFFFSERVFPISSEYQLICLLYLMLILKLMGPGNSMKENKIILSP